MARIIEFRERTTFNLTNHNGAKRSLKNTRVEKSWNISSRYHWQEWLAMEWVVCLVWLNNAFQVNLGSFFPGTWWDFKNPINILLILDSRTKWFYIFFNLNSASTALPLELRCFPLVIVGFLVNFLFHYCWFEKYSVL